MISNVSVVNNAPKCVLGESPRWNDVSGTLTYIDITLKKVYSYNISLQTSIDMEFDQNVGFALPTSTCTVDTSILFVGLENKIIEVDLTNKTILRTILQVPSEYSVKETRFNDGETSPNGDLFAGFMHSKWRDGNPGFYFQIVNTDGTYTVNNCFGMNLPNGSSWLNETTFYLVDSKLNVIYEVTRDLASNTLTRKVIFSLEVASFPSGSILDGMAIDAIGNLWVCCSGASCILCINPATGNLVYRLEVPHPKPTACIFGGENLESLFITSRNTDSNVVDAKGELYVATITGVVGKSAVYPVRV